MVSSGEQVYHEGCYLGISVSAAPAAIIWEICVKEDKTLSLSITIK